MRRALCEDEHVQRPWGRRHMAHSWGGWAPERQESPEGRVSGAGWWTPELCGFHPGGSDKQGRARWEKILANKATDRA